MSDKRPLGFTNRRGHNADLDTADLSDLTIDTQPDEISTLQEPTKKKTARDPKNIRKPRRHRQWSRRNIIIIASIVAVLILIPIITGEVLRIQYQASTDGAKNSLKTIVAHDVLPLQKKSDITAKQVSSITDKLEDVRDGMCPGGLLDNMAMLYPRSRDAHSDCIAERGRIASLVTQMRDMVGMLSFIESMNAALAPVNTPTTDSFAVIATEQTNWQQVSESLQKLSPPSQLKTGYDQLISGVKSITDGWSKLNIANNAQNAADFQAAEKQLSDGYATVRVSKDTFAKAITDKQTIISQQTAKLN